MAADRGNLLMAKRSRILEVLRDIQTDCESDAMALDGQPFTGRVVAEQFGSVLATVKSLAEIVELLVEESAGGY